MRTRRGLRECASVCASVCVFASGLCVVLVTGATYVAPKNNNNMASAKPRCAFLPSLLSPQSAVDVGDVAAAAYYNGAPTLFITLQPKQMKSFLCCPDAERRVSLPDGGSNGGGGTFKHLKKVQSKVKEEKKTIAATACTKVLSVVVVAAHALATLIIHPALFM